MCGRRRTGGARKAAVTTEPMAGEEAEVEPEAGPRQAAFRSCCKEMELIEYRDVFVVTSVDPDSPKLSFSIGRSDGLIQADTGNFNFGDPIKSSSIYGVVGIIRLLTGTYVLVITSRKEVCSHFGTPIFLVKSMKFLSCADGLTNSCYQKSDEAYFRTLLKIIETTPGLYYSYEDDLTLNFQRSWNLAKSRSAKPLWKQADPRFVWNQSMLEELIECKLDQFIIPVIQGSIQSVQVVVKGLPVGITLISRRCTRRLGTRMWRRGANLEGDVANFVETEQLVECVGFRSSFLQIRGSIPLLWEQIADLSYRPQLSILSHEETPKVVERHFHDLKMRYGEIVVVDLTDKCGDEGQLSEKYASEMERVSHVRYVSFDFHRYHCTANVDGLQPLYDNICNDIEKQGYFMQNLEGKLLLEQEGIMRINCIDCLDRTNVTQCYLGRKSLDMQLRRMGVFSANDSISLYPEVNENFNILWVDHGNDVSLEYSGTHALKGDLVRHLLNLNTLLSGMHIQFLPTVCFRLHRFGRQTLSGFIKDGVSAVSRYYMNNFQDGIRQDALDLASGRYNLNRCASSPFLSNGFDSLSYLPIASAVIVGGLTLTTFTINQATAKNAQNVVSSVLWAGLTAGIAALVKFKRRQLCSRPRLCNLL